MTLQNEADLPCRRTVRVPVPLTEEEEKQLMLLARKDSRSKAAMAGIIYRTGLQAYVKGTEQAQ